MWMDSNQNLPYATPVQRQGAYGSPPSFNNNEEVKLYSTTKEREYYDHLAELFSILKATELLERAYVQDAISPTEYTPACTKLLAQYKTALTLLPNLNVKQFIEEYRLACPAAEYRLSVVGMPATMEYPNHEEQSRGARIVAETVQYFITAMDSIKLQMVAVDQLQPLLQDLMGSLNKVANLSADWEGKIKVKNWLTILNKMKASDELGEEQVRQLMFDLETSYTAFHRSLAS